MRGFRRHPYPGEFCQLRPSFAAYPAAPAMRRQHMVGKRSQNLRMEFLPRGAKVITHNQRTGLDLLHDPAGHPMLQLRRQLRMDYNQPHEERAKTKEIRIFL